MRRRRMAPTRGVYNWRCDSGSERLCDLPQPEGLDRGLPVRIPVAARIPEFDALDDAPLARQIDHAGAAAGRDLGPNADLLGSAVAVVHQDAIELDGAVAHAELKRLERPL